MVWCGSCGAQGFGTDLVPFKESVHVDGDLALLRRRERGGGGGGRGGGGEGRDGPEVDEGVTQPVAPAEEEAREEHTAAGGGAAAAERHLSRRRRPQARRGFGWGLSSSYVSLQRKRISQ